MSKDNETMQHIFSFEEDPTMTKWLKVDWQMRSLNHNNQDIVEY